MRVSCQILVFQVNIQTTIVFVTLLVNKRYFIFLVNTKGQLLKDSLDAV